MAVIGLLLPLYTLSIISLLILISFASRTLSSVIHLDKLTLLVMGLSPLALIFGASASAIAAVRRTDMRKAVIGIFLNIILLFVLLYFFTAPLIAEIKVLGW